MLQSRQDTAVVVLSYNGKQLHQDFFPELLQESEGRYDVFLIDNASTDDTAEFVRQQFPEVQIVTIPVNHGFANGYYEGLQHIQAKYYILLSADFEITPGWFQPLYHLMEQRSDLGAIQPKIKYYRDKKMFEYAGAGGGFIDRWGYLFCRGRIFFTLEEDKQQYDDSIETFWAGGGCMFVRAELYHQLGGLDKDLYAHMEEVDLCWRMHSAGYKIGYCAQSKVYHVGGGTLQKSNPHKTFLNFRNNRKLLRKNLTEQELKEIYTVRNRLDTLAAWVVFSKGNFEEAKAIKSGLKAYRDTIPKWDEKRKQNEQLKKTLSIGAPNKYGILNHSIIWSYYIKGIKKFSELKL